MSAQIATGSTVKVRMRGKEKELTIVEPQHVNPTHGHISWSSPLAHAMIGATAGSSVMATLPGGDVLVDILEIL